MLKIARGWSNQKTLGMCTECNKTTEQEIVQYQNKINIGPIPIMGSGPRDFGLQCHKCMTINAINKKDIAKARKFKYYDTARKQTGQADSVNLKAKKRLKYPILTEKDREKFIKHNRREGYLSTALGFIFGIIIIATLDIFGHSPLWGVAVLLFFVIGGLYAAFEDPERKHRDYYRAGKKI
ncbi:MAG: hypothetical protein INQ03_05670 [Candidatus Heimdallarchaeota archaeon]|nr:hypothetical protein [Candidatus Heimdallarchaeota archaeon]